MALIISSLCFCSISLICERLASMISVIPVRFSSNADTSCYNAGPKISAISGFIDLMTLLISCWLLVFWEISVLWSFMTVLTISWSCSTFYSSSFGGISLSFKILVIASWSCKKDLGSLASTSATSIKLKFYWSTSVTIASWWRPRYFSSWANGTFLFAADINLLTFYLIKNYNLQSSNLSRSCLFSSLFWSS